MTTELYIIGLCVAALFGAAVACIIAFPTLQNIERLRAMAQREMTGMNEEDKK